MKPGWIARQSRLPSGWIGEVVGRVMARDTRTANEFALDQFPVSPSDAILEIGCGHGATLVDLATRTDGFVAGIDPSDVMVRLATRRLRGAIDAGRAAVHHCDAAQLPFDDARFDAALAVHVLYFWPDPARELREIRRVLRPGATLLLGFRPDDPTVRAELPGDVYHLRSVAEVEQLLAGAGFEITKVEPDASAAVPFTCLQARAIET
jgi:ubiquinone/menaquinone biosynthesis C-methylase UbiE